MMALIRKYLLSGLLVWLPIWITLLVIHFLVDMMDRTLTILPINYQPDHLLGFHIPGLGLLITLIILFLTGVVAANFFGRWLVNLWDRFMNRIPLVRSIYSGVKKTVDTVFSSTGQAFRKVLLVEYPRKGLWSIAFQTGQGTREVDKKAEADVVTVFVPTTPNPTSGFLIMVPKQEVHELEMTVDEALKMVISLGVIHPEEKEKFVEMGKFK